MREHVEEAPAGPCDESTPVLALIGSEPDTWGPLPEALLAGRLENVKHLERGTVQDSGHFIHMERPAEAAALILGFLER